MPVFEYQAQDSQGNTVKGVVVGSSLDVAARDLSSRGLTVRTIQLTTGTGNDIGSSPVDSGKSFGPVTEVRVPPTAREHRRSAVQSEVLGPLVGKVALTDLHFFFRQLSSMLSAGVNPVQALETLSRQTRSGKLASTIRDMKTHAEGGQPMTAAMQRYPEVFNPLMVSLIRAGEEGGFVSDALRQTSEYVQREIELRNMIRRATIYPKLVVAASIVIILGANIVIGMVATDSAYRLSSPLTSAATWVILGPIIVALLLFFRVGLHNPRVKYNWDQFVLAVPWIGNVVHGFAMAKFGRAFGALYKGGVPIHKGIKLAADACGNEAVRTRIYPASKALESGEGITSAFRSTGAFSNIVLDMTGTGEMTGNLDEMLVKMSEYYEDEGKTKSEQMAWALGVLALLAVGAYVAYVVINFYTGFTSHRLEGLNE